MRRRGGDERTYRCILQRVISVNGDMTAVKEAASQYPVSLLSMALSLVPFFTSLVMRSRQLY